MVQEPAASLRNLVAQIGALCPKGPATYPNCQQFGEAKFGGQSFTKVPQRVFFASRWSYHPIQSWLDAAEPSLHIALHASTVSQAQHCCQTFIRGPTSSPPPPGPPLPKLLVEYNSHSQRALDWPELPRSPASSRSSNFGGTTKRICAEASSHRSKHLLWKLVSEVERCWTTLTPSYLLQNPVRNGLACLCQYEMFE